MKIFQLFGEILIKDTEAQKSLQKTDKSASKLGETLAKGIKTAAKWGAGLVTAAAGAATAVVGALLKMDEATKEYRENQAKLATAWQAAGKDAETAKQAYDGLYRVIGDQDTATEAGQLLASLAQNTEDVAKWTEIAAGVSGTFGESLPINSLIEAANETQKTGQVTGALADALNWGALAGETFGVTLKENTKENEEWNKAVMEAKTAEDFFNLALQETTTEQERNALITDALTQAYSGAAAAFEENNAQTLAARDAQLQLDEAMAKVGEATESVKNAFVERFTPSLTEAAEKAADFISNIDPEEVEAKIKELMETFESFLPVIVGVTAATVAYKTAVTISSIIESLTKATQGLSIAQAALNLVMSMNPFVLIATLIAGVTAALITLWTTNEDFRNAVIGIWENIKKSITDAWESVKETFSGVFEWFKGIGDDMINGLWDGLKSAWTAVSEWVGEKVDWLTDKLFFWRSGKNEMQEFDTPDGSHASGLAYVPYDGYKAILHRGETVLNANDAQGIKDMLKAFMNNQIATNGGMPTRLEIPLYINGREFYRASIDDLRSVAKSNPEVLSKI